MKISVNSIKKEIQEKELERKNAQPLTSKAQQKIKAALTKRNKLLDEVLTRCLDAAIDGENCVDIGYEYPDFHEIVDLLEDRFIEIIDIPGEKYCLRQIEDTLETLDTDQRQGVNRVLQARANAIKFSLNELKPYFENYYGYQELIESVDLALGNEISTEQMIVNLFIAKDAHEEFEFVFDSEMSAKTKQDMKIAIAEIKGDFHEINIVFDSLKFKGPPGEDVYARILRWQKMDDDDVIDNWTSECSDAVSFAYLNTFHGQLFVGAFRSAVEERMASHENLMTLELLKYSSGYHIRLDNEAEMYTVYDEVALDKLLIKLGYSVEFEESNDDEFCFRISWKN